MSQTWDSPWAGTDFANLIIKTQLPNTLDTLRSQFSGASAPTSPTPLTWQRFADTSNAAADGTGGKKVKTWNGSAWVDSIPLGEAARGFRPSWHIASLSATSSLALEPCPCAVKARALQITCATTTSGSVAATKEWQFAVVNVTQSSEALFSAVVGTGTVLAGVGGGEITLETEFELIFDQNFGDLAKGDVLKVTITKVGTPTSPLVDVRLTLDAYAIGS